MAILFTMNYPIETEFYWT